MMYEIKQTRKPFDLEYKTIKRDGTNNIQKEPTDTIKKNYFLIKDPLDI